MMSQSVLTYIGFGANLGDAAATVRWAVQTLAACEGLALVQVASLYRSTPIDSSGDDYINTVAGYTCQLPPRTLLSLLQKIEHQAGRERPYRNAPRTLDLDLLLYGDQHIHTPELTVPHPRMHERAFVLLPLHEIAPSLVSAEQLQAVAGQGIERLASVVSHQ